ncbi:MAG: bifunctional aconitate hydratase 2/2-methylisocitrate dehydratase [Nitrosomonadales bacterium]|jgi:aconitate hydratase 2/2-methylisocitrate dehydratase|nr:bifunctional aconitate hydratase 2/2-methylisocitrate dehydratase [Nitrosomonadales bacterium]MBT5572931.1 bifunctional aconitate hydratase 2/2-methylisocitrate dehydratase [Nitrosomonadales bacterium]
MLKSYLSDEKKRTEQGLPALALNAEQTAELVDLLKKDQQGQSEKLLEIFINKVPAGVDPAAYIKAAFLNDIAIKKTVSPYINPKQATELLSTMLGGYNVQALVKLLDSDQAEVAVESLSKSVLIFDSYYDVEKLHKKGNRYATQVLESWAAADWFTKKSKIPNKLRMIVFKADGEINTDDLSPAQEAWSRPDIPLHAKSMLKNKTPDIFDIINQLKEKKLPIVFVGDIVGTGSSRKSAINSLQWHIGTPIPHIPNKHTGGVILGEKIAPIFFNTAEDSGAIPIECEVSKFKTGDIIEIDFLKKKIVDESNNILSSFNLRPERLLDEARAGGRVSLIIGKGLTEKSRNTLGLGATKIFIQSTNKKQKKHGFTLAQKMVGKACGVDGISPGTYCEPKITTVGSQDTTGAMTRDELKDLACLGFSADLVMQSFCHTAAYPKPVDIELQHTLPEFMSSRGGVSLKAGDGVIHSWLNRMILPDTVGTGGDSHTRFPIGISFPAGSGLVAFAAAIGVMPIDMPESVLVRFSGVMQPGITLRDLVNAIPYYAIKENQLTIGKKGKKNIFNGKILEIEGLPDLKVEQAFEFSDASAERSANGCTVRLDKEPIIEFLKSNIYLMEKMIENGYQDARTLKRRINEMKQWIKNPQLLQPDEDAKYSYVLNIDLNAITEPLVACPNDPDDIKKLSEVALNKIDEVFIGSCMTNIGHYRAAGFVMKDEEKAVNELWIAPPTRMDEAQLKKEGIYQIFEDVGARTEIPGCSLCMGNQARVEDKATVFSTSTRNFDNRMGKDAQVYLGSAELASICALLGHIPSKDEYLKFMKDKINKNSSDIYRYLNFDQLTDYNSKFIEIVPLD